MIDPDGKTGALLVQHYTLSNGARQTSFEGSLEAHSTTRGHTVPQDALRWTDVDVYRTRAGVWVLHKVGRSRVWHSSPTCSKTAQETDLDPLAADDDQRYGDLAPCPVCVGDDLLGGSLDDAEVAWLEEDRGAVSLSRTAAGLVANAYQRDEDGALFIPKVAQYAIEGLAGKWPEVAQAWESEEVA